MTQQIAKTIATASASSSAVSIALMSERPNGSRSVLEASVASIVGRTMLAAMNSRTTASIVKEKRFCSSQPRVGTW